MSKVKGDSIQIGDNGTATQNCTLTANGDGTFTLARGNLGAATQDLLTIDASGKLSGYGIKVQSVITEDGDYALHSGYTLIPLDDTAPQSTEGSEVITASITPTSATNKLIVDAVIHVSFAAAAQAIASLFRDSGTDAIKVAWEYQGGGGEVSTLSIHYEVVAGSTSPTTFKVRCGDTAASNFYFNSNTTANRFNSLLTSYIKVTEIGQ